MILRKLRLQHIRSYVFQEIDFSEGTTLLAGEVGAGKSTLLLAIEFALFGFIKGDISGEALLRHGCARGEVGLSFQVAGHDVYVVRTLKRTAKGVIQDSGSLRVDGIIVPATPLELKAKILDLLQYPADLLTRKSLIFRYTVYTPQEHMQLILLGDQKMRQDTLRRVFTIEKYQVASENVKIVLEQLRAQIRELQGRLHDFPLRLADLFSLEQQEQQLQATLAQTQHQYTNLQQQIIPLQEQTSTLDATLAQVPVLEEQARSLDVQLQQFVSRRQKIAVELADLSAREKTFVVAFGSVTLVDLQQQKKKNAEEIRLLRQEMVHQQVALQQQQTVIVHAERTKSALRDLSLCPTCHQDVHVTHKQHICAQEDAQIATAKSVQVVAQEQLVLLQERLKIAEEQLQDLSQQEQQALLAQTQMAQREEMVQRLAALQQEDVEIKQQIGGLNVRKRDIFSTLTHHQTLVQQRDAVHAHVRQLQSQEQLLLLEITRLQKGLEDLHVRLVTLQTEITAQEQLQVQLSRQMALSSWLSAYFLPLLGNLERSVMVTLRADFEKWFVEWFSFLLGDHHFHLGLADDFSPLILQHGHPIQYAYLSGGERTALALSYRLALNQVINRLVTTLQTRDLIILDEPTDGFSSTQIDRLRHVLERLQMRQVLLVSHEPKIESFCDAVIYITKEGSTSAVA